MITPYFSNLAGVKAYLDERLNEAEAKFEYCLRYNGERSPKVAEQRGKRLGYTIALRALDNYLRDHDSKQMAHAIAEALEAGARERGDLQTPWVLGEEERSIIRRVLDGEDQ